LATSGDFYLAIDTGWTPTRYEAQLVKVWTRTLLP
jgi:hypothetical protein